ncbi:MAG: ATP-binding protein [Spirochaetia bacterium]|nr:ATP-binding protein [Spirochaetia bacterium]
MLELFKTIIADFHQRKLPGPIIPRELTVPLDSGKIISIIGPRRTGKTWFLYSLIDKLRKTVDPVNIVYINFEDERVDIGRGDLHKIIDAYQQLYPSTDLSDVYFFFDEIQEVEGWEKFIRRVQDTVSTKLWITGSSSRLMGREIASSLRGRALSFTLFPFSFREYLRYHGVSPEAKYATREKNRIINHFDAFLWWGGFPEIFGLEEQMRIKTMQSYVDVMLYRDIIERHEIGKVHLVKDMLKRLISGNARSFSVHKYYNDLKSRGISVGKNSLYELVGHFEDAFAVLSIPKYHDSPVKQEQSFKKVYVNDPGVLTAYRFSNTPDMGWYLETFVLLELIKAGYTVFFHSNGFETDFLVYDGVRIVGAVQACYELNDENRQRELRGLQKAMQRFALGRGSIISHSQEESIHLEEGVVEVTPAWKWALGDTL